MTQSSTKASPFDAYADNYDAILARGLSVFGEDKNYFARGRVVWLTKCLRRLGHQPRTVMDFGCGTGSATPFLQELLGSPLVLGLDLSPRSVELARQSYGSNSARFLVFDQYQPKGQIDLVFCNGVFHHIPPPERAGAIDYIYRCLRPGGIFAFWENNPWNPGTRYLMSRIPFDRDAIALSPPIARRLVREGGFDVLMTRHLFIFPRILRWLRWSEPHLALFPLGAQYQVLCRRPNT
jgi:SAM-dependent methyltransferase